MPKSPVSKPRSASFGALGATRFRRAGVIVAQREQLEAALDYVREGDIFTVTKLDRLARSVGDLLEIVARLEAKKVSLRVLSMSGAQPLDTGTATGRLMLAVIGAVGQAEREAMLERQREGIAKAKREGRYKGRVPTARRKADEIIRLKESGIRPSEIANRLGIGRASVYRVLTEHQDRPDELRRNACGSENQCYREATILQPSRCKLTLAQFNPFFADN